MIAPTSIGAAAAMSQSIIFIGYDLAAKRLRERGVDSIELSQALRMAFLPSLALLAMTWNWSAIRDILADPVALWALFGFVTSALIFQWVYFKCMHVSHSLAVASVTRNAIGLPLLMVIGIFVNGDHPTVWGVCGLGLMIAASFIRPGRSRLDRRQYIESAKTVIGLSAAFVVLVTIKDPLYRLWLQKSHSLILGIAIYMVIFTAGLHVYFAIRPVPATAAATLAVANSKWLILAIPVFFIAGTIPEGVAFGLLPVYSMIAIGTVSWIITIGSDIYFKRLAPTLRTALFASTVLSSILFALIDRGVLQK